MEVPSDLKYTENDEWIRVEGGVGTIGVTDFAQEQLSDIVYVEVLSAVGDKVAKGDAVATLESVKAAADVYSPVSGTITEINEELADTPEMVNSEPYGGAWMVKLEVEDPAELETLLDVEGYKKSAEERAH